MTKIERTSRDQELARVYSSGLKIKDIAEQYGVDPSTVHNILTREGCNRQRNHRLTDNEITKAITLYGRLPLYKVAERLDVSDRNVRAVLLRSGVGIRRGTYEYDESVFSNMADSETAYWFGLLLSDGTIDSRESVSKLSIALQRADHRILYRLRRYLGSADSPIRIFREKYSKDSQDSIGISICNKVIVDRLKSYGLVPRKTWKLKWPGKVIDDNNFRAFLLGYSDGNGCWYHGVNKTGQIQCVWYLASTEPFLLGVKKRIEAQFPGLNIHSTKNGGGHLLQLRSLKYIREFIDWLYEGQDLYMPRKKQKALAVKKALNKYYR